MRTVYLDSTVIFYPKIDLEYVIRIPQLLEVKVQFEGKRIKELIKFDASTGIFILRNYPNDQIGGINSTEFEGVQLIPRSSLPPSMEHLVRSPINLIEDDNPQDVIEVRKITFAENDMQFGLEFEACESVELNCIISKAYISQAMQANKGEFPLFKEEIKPSYEALEKICADFFRFNTEDKLKQQSENTKDLCHLRAHFISILLRICGINSYRLFKKMNPLDWEEFGTRHSYWFFHAATLVIDSDDKPWVLDPWVFSNKLLTPKEWLFCSNHPKPSKVLIANHIVVSDLKGRMADGENFCDFTSSHNIGALQLLISSAIPSRIYTIRAPLDNRFAAQIIELLIERYKKGIVSIENSR